MNILQSSRDRRQSYGQRLFRAVSVTKSVPKDEVSEAIRVIVKMTEIKNLFKWKYYEF